MESTSTDSGRRKWFEGEAPRGRQVPAGTGEGSNGVMNERRESTNRTKKKKKLRTMGVEPMISACRPAILPM